MSTWMKAQTSDKWSSPIVAARYNELSFLLYMVGSPLIPFQIQLGQSVNRPVKHSSIILYLSRRTEQNECNMILVLSLNYTKELLISGCKVISGSNGKISWRQSSNQIRPISKGPPRPLRRFLQTPPRALEAQRVQIMRYYITPSGDTSAKDQALVVKFLEDSRLLTVKTSRDDEGVFWETSTESVMEDYKHVDGVNVAHSGKTFVTVFRYGEHSANHKRRLSERWKIEEVDFNVGRLDS
ncbi:hypothetical protein HAX54_001639 [Datura stramonium]|uniref:Uncharacterized protein n=1 Tax=Datura stramonium TaxID=4076 RepID=A0ABS8T4S2_DATST|nr:hypothetical protein [Datura stramonium]